MRPNLPMHHADKCLRFQPLPWLHGGCSSQVHEPFFGCTEPGAIWGHLGQFGLACFSRSTSSPFLSLHTSTDDTFVCTHRLPSSVTGYHAVAQGDGEFLLLLGDTVCTICTLHAVSCHLPFGTRIEEVYLLTDCALLGPPPMRLTLLSRCTFQELLHMRD